MQGGQIRTINLIIKGDVQGSVETLVNTVTASNTDEVKVRVIHSGVGPINESDVELAMATMTKPTDNEVAIIGFHVVPDERPARWPSRTTSRSSCTGSSTRSSTT